MDIILVSGARAFISVGVQISLLAPDFQGFSLKVFFVNVAINVAKFFTPATMISTEQISLIPFDNKIHATFKTALICNFENFDN